ncbi:MAG: hypothetical protein RR547_12275 [Raoultibacter sp.]
MVSTIEYGCDYVRVSMNLERYSTDWLGNTRLEKGHDELCFNASRSNDLCIMFKTSVFDGTPEELFELIDEAQRFRELGISIGDDEDKIIIDLKKSEESNE